VHREVLVSVPEIRAYQNSPSALDVDDDDARARRCGFIGRGFHDEDRLRGATAEPPSSSSRAIRRAAVCLCQGEPMAETLLSQHRAASRDDQTEKEKEREEEELRESEGIVIGAREETSARFP